MEITQEFINKYKNCSFRFQGKANGYFLEFITQKQIIFVCFDNVKQQIIKSLNKRNILIEYETSKIYNKEHKKNINIFLIKYQNHSKKLSIKALFKKYEIKEKQKRKDINLKKLMYLKNE